MLFKEIKKELKSIDIDIEEYERKIEELKKRKTELLNIREEKKKRESKEKE